MKPSFGGGRPSKLTYDQLIEYTQIVNPYKFKINTTGSLTINGNSTIKITLNLLNKENIISKMQTEQRLCLILDNYSVYKSAFIKKIALHLNITLIYIPPYSPHLNPIKQIWRQMKREIKHYYLKSKEFLEDLTIKTYIESILDTKVYYKLFETYLPKVW